MKFLIGCLLSAFMGSVYTFTYAQTGYAAINGTVLTQDHMPAPAAAILLKFADSSIVKSTLCRQNGAFEFNNIPPGDYLVAVHMSGYMANYSAHLHLTADKSLSIGEIVLVALNKQLSEVTVTDKRDYIQVLPGKTVLNVDRTILAAGTNAFEILNIAPGVRVIDDGILLNGGEKALIAINGKPIGNLTGEQLADLLKSYQSSQISRVELIQNPSAKYDAAGGGGVINIILKKNKDQGFRASVMESAALGQDYKLNTGLNMNYRLPQVNFFASYNFSNNKLPRLLDVDRIIPDNGSLTDIDVNYHSTYYSKVNNFNAGTDFNITPKQTIGALIYGYVNSTGIDKTSITQIKNNGVLDSVLTTRSHINRPVTNVNYNLNYKGSFGKSDETSLTADIDYSTYNRNSIELLENEYLLPDGVAYNDPLFYMDNSPSSITVRSEKIDFSQALTKNSTLSAGLKNNEVNSNNTIDFEQRVDTAANFTPVAFLTDHFVYKERINAAYASYNNKFGKSNLTLGLRAEQTNSFGISYHPDKTVSRDYFDLFPNFLLTHAIDTNNKLSVSYNRRIGRPNYQDLNPFVGYIGQYSFSTGNPFLKPEYFNNYEISDMYKEKYKVSLSMIVTRDFFAPVYQQNDSSKVFITTNNNIGKRYVYQLTFNVPVTITKWWQANIYLLTAYERYIYNADSATRSTYDIVVQVNQSYKITSTLSAELYGEWESPTYYGIKQYQAQSAVRAGLSQSILKNNGSIRLNVSDIFNSDEYRYTSNYANLNLTGREKAGTRFVTLAFFYRFGKQSVLGARRRVGGNTEEQRRLSGSSNEN